MSMPRSLFSRNPDTVLVGPSSLGSPHGCRPLKTGISSTGYDALPSVLKREAGPHTIGMATKSLGQLGESHQVFLWIQALYLSMARLMFPCFWSKGDNHK